MEVVIYQKYTTGIKISPSTAKMTDITTLFSN
jgi:hypothetical protein